MATDAVLSITLPAGLERFARSQVSSGQFANVDEVVREALRLFEALAEPPTQSDIARLKAKLDEGVRQADAGNFVTWDEVMKRIAVLKEQRR
jgi:putative addiction module CopG family antidote